MGCGWTVGGTGVFQPLWTTQVPISRIAIEQFDRTYQDAAGKLVRADVIYAVFFQHLCLIALAVATQRRVDVDRAAYVSRSRTILDRLYSSHNRFSMGLPNA